MEVEKERTKRFIIFKNGVREECIRAWGVIDGVKIYYQMWVNKRNKKKWGKREERERLSKKERKEGRKLGIYLWQWGGD